VRPDVTCDLLSSDPHYQNFTSADALTSAAHLFIVSPCHGLRVMPSVRLSPILIIVNNNAAIHDGVKVRLKIQLINSRL